MPEPAAASGVVCRSCTEAASVLFLFTTNRRTLGPPERAYCAVHAAAMRLNFRHRIVDERLISAHQKADLAAGGS